MVAEHGEAKQRNEDEKHSALGLRGIQDNTIRIARLKLLMIAAKLVCTGNTTKVKYSEHDSRAEGLFRYMAHLDQIRRQDRPWLDGGLWQCRHMEVLKLKTASRSP